LASDDFNPAHCKAPYFHFRLKNSTIPIAQLSMLNVALGALALKHVTLNY
jgi:hypothetical protein